MPDPVPPKEVRPPRVFISYSHDSPEHDELVLQLSERLRQDGLDAQIDQYVKGKLQTAWARWMLDQLDWADSVVLVCTKTYYLRFRGKEVPGKGYGVDWEGSLITNEIYGKRSVTNKFLPVLFAEPDKEFIPEPLGGDFFLLNSDAAYQDLKNALAGGGGIVPGPLGQLIVDPSRTGSPLSFPGQQAPDPTSTTTTIVRPVKELPVLAIHRIRCTVARKIPTSAEPAGWKVEYEDGNPAVVPPRELRRAGDATAEYPVPLEVDLPAAGSDLFTLCADLTGKPIHEVMDRLITRTPQPGDLELFGRYLFQTLIGEANWATLSARATAGGLIELALIWPIAEGAFHRLPWEMMYGPQGFLVSGVPHSVTITRLVDDQGAIKSSRVVTRPPASPVRMLFVAGASLQDRELRAGAEYFGLLRELEARDRRNAVVPRTLFSAKPREVTRSLAEFRPDVVHIICPGVSIGGEGHLVLQLDDGEHGDELRARNAGLLKKYLTVPDRADPTRMEVPSLVILSACQGGTLSLPGQGAWLAAELVRQGMPAVLMMAGEVSDQACRLFTRAFGEAMLTGQPLAAAMARGRRAVFAAGNLASQSVDWAWPALYLSQDLPATHAVAKAQADPSEIEQQHTLNKYGLPRLPAFAARDEPLEEGFRLLREGSIGALALTGDAGFGKTRLLLELAAQAVREGQIPILLASERSTWQAPTTTDAFITMFMSALQSAGSAYGVAVPPSRWTLRLRSSASPADFQSLPAEIRDAKQLQSGANLALQLAMRADLEALIAAIKQRSARVRVAEGRPWLLMDEVHLYDKTLIEDLFGSEFVHLLGPYGFGEEPARSIPTVLAYTITGPALKLLERVKEQPQVYEWLRQTHLDPFDPVREEDLLAYSRVLLHPHNPELQQGVSDVGWTFNPRAPVEARNFWIQKLRKGLKHTPEDFNNPVLYFWVDLAAGQQVLIKADDEAILRQFKP